MSRENVSWLAFEVGLVLVTGLLLLFRMSTAINFEITYDGVCLAIFTFGLGMLFRELTS